MRATDDRDLSGQHTNFMGRREFVALSAAVSFSVATGGAQGVQIDVNTQDVQIVTPDGICDAVFVHPVRGKAPGVLLWTDAFGLRPAFRNFAMRLAHAGYAVLVPNPFYRVSVAPQYTDVAKFNFGDAESKTKLMKPMNALLEPGVLERDTLAYLNFLGKQAAVRDDHRLGVHGYCMGGLFALRTAALAPERIAAAASFHGGGLVTGKPDSPHLQAAKIRAALYLGIAASDDQQQPEAKDVLRKAFADAHLDAKIEVYPAPHGWCVPDMPMREGQPTYRADQAERAWAELLSFYQRTLA